MQRHLTAAVRHLGHCLDRASSASFRESHKIVPSFAEPAPTESNAQDELKKAHSQIGHGFPLHASAACFTSYVANGAPL
jgi:hypothetical protein